MESADHRPKQHTDRIGVPFVVQKCKLCIFFFVLGSLCWRPLGIGRRASTGSRLVVGPVGRMDLDFFFKKKDCFLNVCLGCD